MAWYETGGKPLPESMIIEFTDTYSDGLAQDCSNSIANALELLQSCAKPSICVNRPKCVEVSLYNPTHIL